MEIRTIGHLRAAFRSHGYAWPGGYPLYFVMSDGEALSFKAAKAELRLLLEALRDNDSTGRWLPFALEINWEDSNLFCAHTNERIESAYGDDETEECGK